MSRNQFFIQQYPQSCPVSHRLGDKKIYIGIQNLECHQRDKKVRENKICRMKSNAHGRLNKKRGTLSESVQSGHFLSENLLFAELVLHANSIPDSVARCTCVYSLGTGFVVTIVTLHHECPQDSYIRVGYILPFEIDRWHCGKCWDSLCL